MAKNSLSNSIMSDLFYDMFRNSGDIFGDILYENSYSYYIVNGAKCIYITMPGVKKEDLNITVEGDVLKVIGVRKLFGKDEKLTQQIRTSKDFDVTKVEAKLEDGILTLSIPQEEEQEEKPAIKTIPIK